MMLQLYFSDIWLRFMILQRYFNEALTFSTASSFIKLLFLNPFFLCLFVSFSRRKLGNLVSKMVILCAPNRLHEFHSLTKEEDECILADFFKYRHTGMSAYWVEHLIENYQGSGICILNDNEVKMDLKDVTLISGLKVAKTNFRPTKASHPTCRDRYFLRIKKVTYQDINQAVFNSRLIRDIKSGERDRLCLLFFLCTTFFSSSYDNLYPSI